MKMTANKNGHGYSLNGSHRLNNNNIMAKGLFIKAPEEDY